MSESKKVENSNKGVAGAKPGDIIIRLDGTEVKLKQYDIDLAKQQLEQEKSKTPQDETCSSSIDTKTDIPLNISSSYQKYTKDEKNINTQEEDIEQDKIVESDIKQEVKDDAVSTSKAYIAATKKKSNSKLNFWKELSEIISEIRVGLVNKASISIPNVVQFEVELNLISNEYKRNKDGSSQSGITSGIGVSYQLGADHCPFVTNSIQYSKYSPDVGNAFSLLETDYFLSQECVINSDINITIPIPFVNVSLNLNEGYDLYKKVKNHLKAN